MLLSAEFNEPSMIISRAPLRISFVGGGTDLPAVYRQFGGQVLSTTIDKYVYFAIKPTPLVDSIIVKYRNIEVARHPSEIAHSRIREALIKHAIITEGIEIASFADVPAKTGLGSSSTFTVALLAGLWAYQRKDFTAQMIAQEACELEINIINEPIGKQDQYAAAFGGWNIFRFYKDERVEREKILLDETTEKKVLSHILLIYTGMTRDAGAILSKQRQDIGAKLDVYKKMAAMVPPFAEALLEGNVKKMAELLHEGWQYKRSLSAAISNNALDILYEAGINAGAWGGKILGAGGGGCLLFIAPSEIHENIKMAISKAIHGREASIRPIPFSFSKKGVEVVFDSNKIYT